MNSNKKYDFYKNTMYFLIANAVLLVAGIIIFAIFGFNFETAISGSKLLLSTALTSILSLLVILIYVGFRYDFAKALSIVLTSVHNILLSTVLIILIRVPVTESLVAGYALIIGLSTIFTLILTEKFKDENLKKADYSGVIKGAISQNLKQIVAFSAIVIAVLFLSLIVSSKDMFGFARMFFVMMIVVLYSTFTIILPFWCFFSSKIKKIKRAKADEEVENQKVIKAVQTETQTNENE